MIEGIEEIETSGGGPRGSMPSGLLPVLSGERQTAARMLMPRAGSAAEVAHDARNVLASLRLYCELLAEPGVLVSGFRHYAAELEAIATAGTGLVEQLAAKADLAERNHADAAEREDGELGSASFEAGLLATLNTGAGIEDLPAVVRALGPLLAAMAGPQIETEVECLAAPGTIPLSEEDLTRILTNLVNNAREAIRGAGRIRITVQRGGGASFLPGSNSGTVLLAVQDNGPGIAAGVRERVFDPGFSTRNVGGNWPRAANRGLGLSIVRALVEAAGGEVRVVSAPGHGARFEMEFPVSGTGPAKTFVTRVAGEGQVG